MANYFKTVVKTIPTEITIPLYSCPSSKAAVVMMAQVSNVSESTATVTFYLSRLNVSSVREYHELLKNSPIPKADARSMVSGRMVLEANDQIHAVASSSNVLKLTLSLLETDL